MSTLSAYTLNDINFDDLHITDAGMVDQASGRGTLSLTCSRPLNAAELFPPFNKVILRENGIIRGSYWLDLPARAGEPHERRQVTMSNALRFLDLATFTQPRPVVGASAPWELRVLSAVMLGQTVRTVEDGQEVEIDKISAALQFTKLAEQFYEQFSIHLLGGLPDLKLPWLPKTNALIGSCIYALLAWFPSFGMRAEATGDAIVMMDAATDGTEHEIDPDLLDIRAGYTAIPRYDLLLSETRLIYTKPGSGTINGAGEVIAETLEDSATTSNGSPRKLIHTVELEQGEEFPDLGLAAQYHAWAGHLLLDTHLPMWGLHWGIRPLDVLSLVGLGSDGIKPVVQSIERDLRLGTITISAGPRNQLGLDQLLELNRKTPKGGGGGGGSPDPDKETAEVTRTIQDPESNPIDGAYFFVGGQQAASGSTVTVPAGTHKILYVVPPDYRPPAEETVTLTKGGASGSTVTATWRDRIQLKQADGAAGRSVDINVIDIAEDGGTAKMTLMVGVHLGAVMQCEVLGTPWREIE